MFTFYTFLDLFNSFPDKNKPNRSDHKYCFREEKPLNCEMLYNLYPKSSEETFQKRC